MNVFLLLILIVIIIFTVIFFLVSKRREDRNDKPYILSSLSDEDRDWLADTYDRTMKPGSGLLGDGGVWREKLSDEQKLLLVDIKCGRLSENGYAELIAFVSYLKSKNQNNKELTAILSEMERKIIESDYCR